MKTSFALISAMFFALTAATSLGAEPGTQPQIPTKPITFHSLISIGVTDMTDIKLKVAADHPEVSADLLTKTLLDKKIALELISKNPALIQGDSDVNQYVLTRFAYTISMMQVFAYIADSGASSPRAIAHIKVLQRVYPGLSQRDSVTALSSLIEQSLSFLKPTFKSGPDDELSSVLDNMTLAFEKAKAKLQAAAKSQSSN